MGRNSGSECGEKTAESAYREPYSGLDSMSHDAFVDAGCLMFSRSTISSNLGFKIVRKDC